MTPKKRPPRGLPPRRHQSPLRNPRELPRPGAEVAFDLSDVEEAALLQALARVVAAESVAESADRFRAYLSGLVGWNIRSNLVAAGDRDRLVRRHVVESLACVPLLDRLGGTDLIDLGSGGGFPGIPIKLVRPQLRLALVESRRMKSLFLTRTIESLRLQDSAVWQIRIEALGALPPSDASTGFLSSTPSGLDGPALRPAADLVTARAVAPLATLSAWVAPVVKAGGHLVTFKGSRVDEELAAWEVAPGPWALASLERDAAPGLTLLALRREPGEAAPGD